MEALELAVVLNMGGCCTAHWVRAVRQMASPHFQAPAAGLVLSPGEKPVTHIG